MSTYPRAGTGIFNPYIVPGQSTMFSEHRGQQKADKNGYKGLSDSDDGSDDNSDVPAVVYGEDELPDLDRDAAVAGRAAGGQPALKKGMKEKKLWIWEEKDLPFQEISENSVKPVGFDWCRLLVEFFMKMFEEENWQELAHPYANFRLFSVF